MSGSDDPGVVLSASKKQNDPGIISASKEASIIISDNTIESGGDLIPTQLDENLSLPGTVVNGGKSQLGNANIAEAFTEDKDKASVKSEDNDSDGSDIDEGDVSEGTSVDEHLERYRTKYENMRPRIKLGPKRARQANQYTRILEERLSLLEDRATTFDQKLRRIAKGKDKLPSPPPPPSPPPDESGLFLKPELHVQLSKGLRSLRHGLNERRPPSTHQIDVYVGEPEAQKPEKVRRQETESNILEDEDLDDQAIRSESKFEQSSELFDERRLEEELDKIKSKHFPNRIRINGLGLANLFRKFLTGSSHRLDDVILRPFKPLLQNKDEIFTIMSELESALTRIVDQRANQSTDLMKDDHDLSDFSDSSNSDHPKNPANGRSSSSDSEDSIAANYKAQRIRLRTAVRNLKRSKSESYHKFRALQRGPDAITAKDWDVALKQVGLFDEHNGCYGLNMRAWPALSEVKKSFECVKALFHNYLLPGHMDFRERKAKKVRFSDLWHLFRTGDMVVTGQLSNLDETETQALLGMRVLMTSGGRRVIIGRLPAPSLPSTAKLSTDRNPIEPINGINPFCIHAYYLDFNGSRLVPVRRRIVIAPYLGERNILDLDVIPIEYTTSTAHMLQKRGQKFIEIVTAPTASYMDCKGLALGTREEINDKVMVDMKGYLSINPNEMPTFREPEELDLSETSDCYRARGCGSSSFNCDHRTRVVHDQTTDLKAYQEYVDDKPVFNPQSTTSKAGLVEPSDFSICNYRVFAYKLRSREWVRVNVKDLETQQDIDNSRGFEKLVLSEDHKQILESQVREHFRKKKSNSVKGNAENDMDLVRGKGQGLIILLHGAPGVGKTCTAECIADLMEKPLYPITCGDLGSSAEDVEKNLKKHFTLASRWDCVMLLDEADVFLAERKLDDLQRNSIVSVFLRMLEYYKGLLFLTTNRVGIFDEAFTSRVHISLFYPNFDKETTLKVWRTFINQTRYVLEISGRTNVTIDAEAIEKFAKKHWKEHKQARWNGRQIRNAFHTAVAMAEFEARQKIGVDYDDDQDVKISVGRAEFEKIANTAREFDDYINETKQGDPDFLASRRGLRKQLKEPKEKTKEKERAKEKTKKKKKKSSKSKKQSDTSSESETDSDDDDDDDSDDD